MACGGDTAQLLEELPDLHSPKEIDDDVYAISEDLCEDEDHSGNSLFRLAKRARSKIWGYLDFESLRSVSETCSRLEGEILNFVAPANEHQLFHVTTFLDVLPILAYTPLDKYLDLPSKLNLRLTCKLAVTVVDHFWVKPKIGSDLCRWGTIVSLRSFGYSEESSCSDQVGQEAKLCESSLTIFDIYTQDLKRIFSYVSAADLDSLQRACASFSRLVKELRMFPFQENKDSSAQITLMDLPTEIHEKILGCCHSSDRPTLRLVSKLMQFQVDTLAGVAVVLNDSKWVWGQTTLGKLPPASTLIVTKIDTLKSINYFVSDYNSKLLARLILDGNFLPSALIKIFRLCKNLRFVGFTYALDMESLEDELRKSSKRYNDLPIELPSLKSLNLKIREDDLPQENIFRVHAWTWVNAFEMMKPSLISMPRLSSFRICEKAIFSHKLLYEVADKVLKFVLEHQHTLKYMEVVLLGTCFQTCVCPTYHSEVSEEALRNLKLKTYAHDCDWRISWPFTVILKTQRSLEELTCFKLSDWEFYAGIIGQNNVTLRSVTIEKNLAPVIDLGAFASCKNLEYLWISQGGSSTIRGHDLNLNEQRIVRFDPRITNLDRLPVCIKFLHILDQTADTTQIKSIPRRLKNLETLELQFLGSWDGNSFGMTGDTVAEIVQLRKLNCLFLEEIRTLDFHYIRHEPDILSEINLIPKECSQILINYGCVVVGILIAEKLPSADFMPEWRARVESYFEYENRALTWNVYYRPHNDQLRPDIIALLEDDEEEEEEEDDQYESENEDNDAANDEIDN